MKVSLLIGDITKFDSNVDVIVNAANESLRGGGGVDGAIHRAAGPNLLKECYSLNGCKPGEAKVTRAYNLPQKYIIHTVGPRFYSESNPSKTLENCYLNSLKLADELGAKVIAFPSISTGVFCYPIKDAAKVFAIAMKEYKPKNITQVIMCIYNDEKALEVYKSELDKIMRCPF